MRTRVLIAEDDPISRLMLLGLLEGWGYQVTAVADGAAALQELEREGGPRLAVLDWEMPGLAGVEVCRRVKMAQRPAPPYMLLLTARDGQADLVAGLDAGANDFLTKPFERDELRARLGVGRSVVELQDTLALRVRELEAALENVKQLSGLLPICAYCKKIRDGLDYWQRVEDYITRHSAARFSHGICPDCIQSVVEVELRAAREAGAGRRPTPPIPSVRPTTSVE